MHELCVGFLVILNQGANWQMGDLKKTQHCYLQGGKEVLEMDLSWGGMQGGFGCSPSHISSFIQKLGKISPFLSKSQPIAMGWRKKGEWCLCSSRKEGDPGRSS